MGELRKVDPKKADREEMLARMDIIRGWIEEGKITNLFVVVTHGENYVSHYMVGPMPIPTAVLQLQVMQNRLVREFEATLEETE